MQQPELKQVRILKTKVIPITFSSQGARPSYDQSLKPDKGGQERSDDSSKHAKVRACRYPRQCLNVLIMRGSVSVFLYTD